MFQSLKSHLYTLLRQSEKYTKTDMVYLAKNSFWTNANTIVTSILAFILSILFAQFVSKDTYGTYQFLLSLGSIIGGLTLMGMNNAVAQAVARGYEGTFKKAIYEQLKFAYIPFTVGILGAIYYFIFENITLSASLLIIAILLPLSNVFNTWSAYLTGKSEFRHQFLYSQLFNIIYYGGLFLLIVTNPDTLPLVSLTYILMVIGNICAYTLVTRTHKPRDISDDEAIDYGKKLSLSNILPMIVLNIDNLIIFHFLGPTQLAVYAFASNIPERLGGIIKQISTIALPKLAKKNESELSRTIPQKTKQLFFISLISGVAYVIIAPFIFNIFFPAYTNSVIYSQVYTLVIILSITTSLPLTAIFATRSSYIYSLNISHPIYSTVLILAGVYYFGLWGALIGKIISGIILLVQTHTHVSTDTQE